MSYKASYNYKFWEKDESESSPAPDPCHHEGCEKQGIHRAPKKDKSSHPKQPHSWLWFCLDHVREYNSHWNYYAHMNEEEIKEEWRKDVTWQRPSWPMGDWHTKPWNMWQKSSPKKEERKFHFHDPFDLFNDSEFTSSSSEVFKELQTPEAQAMKLLGLSFPFNAAQLQSAYRALVKKFHPDVNQNNPKAEEMIRNVNHAYQLLKKKLSAF